MRVIADNNWPGLPYGPIRPGGRGTVYMGRQAVQQGYYPPRIASHEFGHIVGLPDRRTGLCADLMSSGLRRASCTNMYPNANEAARINYNYTLPRGSGGGGRAGARRRLSRRRLRPAWASRGRGGRRGRRRSTAPGGLLRPRRGAGRPLPHLRARLAALRRARCWSCCAGWTGRSAGRTRWTWWTSAPAAASCSPRCAPRADPALRARLRLTAVEVGPVDLPGVRVVRDVAELPELTGLLVANEWLDDVPLDLVEQTADRPRVVLVAPTGAESMGDPPAGADAAWLDRWWPLAAVGDRAEVGRSRDEAWAAAVGRLARGVAVAVDYGHEAGRRPAGRHAHRLPRRRAGAAGAGRLLRPHRARGAGLGRGRRGGRRRHRDPAGRPAGRAAGARPGRPPAAARARHAPTRPAYLRGLQRAGEAAELIDRAGLGAFGWLVQGVGVPLPFPPLATRARVRRKPAPPPAETRTSAEVRRRHRQLTIRAGPAARGRAGVP